LWNLEISKGELPCSDHVSKVPTKTFILFDKKLHVYLRLGTQYFQFAFGHSIVNPTRQAGKSKGAYCAKRHFQQPSMYPKEIIKK
jgi:hypothetical protein